MEYGTAKYLVPKKIFQIKNIERNKIMQNMGNAQKMSKA